MTEPDDSFAEEFLLVRAVFEEVLGVTLDGVDGHARIAQDLGADSLEMAEVIAALEEKGLYVDESALGPEQTLGGLLNAIVR